jgi:hypothetical protein
MKFAIVMTCTEGLHINANAAFNGLTLYGNDVDIHLLSKDINKPYLEKLPSNFILPPWSEVVDPNKPSHKKGGWEVRFYRYRYVRSIADQYDAVMTLDADVFVVGNLMEHFERAATEGVMIMPDNPRGSSLDKANLDNIKGAASPPYHCHPFFFDPKKYDWLMEQVYDWGIKEDYGDMATLYRTLFRNNKHREVVAIPNDLYCFTDWHFDKIESTMENGLPLLKYKGEQMKVVHRRWYLQSVRDKFRKDLGPQHREFGEHNLDVFEKTINWLNDNGPIKL